MRDLAERGPLSSGAQFNTIKRVLGRTTSVLPILSNTGEKDYIHPYILTGFFVPGLEKIQFVSKSLSDIEINYVSSKPIEKEISKEFEKIIRNKSISPSVRFSLKKTNNIPVNKKTGKFDLIVYSDLANR